MDPREYDTPQVYDAIMIGGGSRLAIAVAAAEGKATVLLLGKALSLGGTTGIAIGSFTANGTLYQRHASARSTRLARTALRST